MNPTYAEVEAALLGRWPETRLEPSLERITALCRLLGDPQDAYPVVHLTGTNGKSSTARMIDALLRALDLRTGRFTSPHLQSMTERISLDGEPLTEEQFVEAFADVAAYAQVVDDSQPHPISFFELTVAMAYAAFADAPVDAAVVEVGMGGAWDATNVATGRVAVVTPVAVDHTAYLGDRAVDIALEKSGIIKPGAHAVLAAQEPEVLDVLMRRSMEVGATALREGVDFGVADRLNAVGGQQISLQGLNARYDDVLLQLHGAHQAQNAAVALASVEAFVGAELDGDLVRSAFGEVTSPCPCTRPLTIQAVLMSTNTASSSGVAVGASTPQTDRRVAPGWLMSYRWVGSLLMESPGSRPRRAATSEPSSASPIIKGRLPAAGFRPRCS